jgi:hypothetical protein
MYDMTEQELQVRFRAINGLLLPGGGAELRPGQPFYDTAARLVQLAVEANDKGDYFPVSWTHTAAQEGHVCVQCVVACTLLAYTCSSSAVVLLTAQRYARACLPAVGSSSCSSQAVPCSFSHWLGASHCCRLLPQVHGTCLGLEVLSIIVSGNTSLLADMDAEDFPAPLLYTQDADSSPFLKSLPPHIITNLQNQPLAMENHMHGENVGSWLGDTKESAALQVCRHM